MEKPHKKLNVWKRSVELAVLLCRTTDAFPKSEQFGLAAQIRRAGVSIPSNIAEGAARQTKKEFIQSYIWLKVLSVNWTRRLRSPSSLGISMIVPREIPTSG